MACCGRHRIVCKAGNCQHRVGGYGIEGQLCTSDEAPPGAILRTSPNNARLIIWVRAPPHQTWSRQLPFLACSAIKRRCQRGAATKLFSNVSRRHVSGFHSCNRHSGTGRSAPTVTQDASSVSVSTTHCWHAVQARSAQGSTGHDVIPVSQVPLQQTPSATLSIVTTGHDTWCVRTVSPYFHSL